MGWRKRWKKKFEHIQEKFDSKLNDTFKNLLVYLEKVNFNTSSV